MQESNVSQIVLTELIISDNHFEKKKMQKQNIMLQSDHNQCEAAEVMLDIMIITLVTWKAGKSYRLSCRGQQKMLDNRGDFSESPTQK
jgi:hypothetical protein